MNKTIPMTDALYSYLTKYNDREDELAKRLREETAQMPESDMQISLEQARFLSFLTRLIGAKRCLEIGVFTGYSALTMARALPADGSIVACDISEEWTQIASRYWQEAEVEQKIDLRLAPALDTLDDLLEVGRADSFDLAFIDADKSNLLDYYEQSLILLRSGGLIIVDNTLWNGWIVDKDRADPDTEAIRKLNSLVHSDDRVDMCLLPVADGMLLARKRW